MTALAEILEPDFLLRNALLATVLMGLVCPIVGAWFVLRRMIFLGVALPQLSAAGISFAFLVTSVLGFHTHGEPAERLLATAGSLGFALLGMAALAALERRGSEMLEARIGIAYAFAASAGILFAAADPHGESEVAGLLRGDVVGVSDTGMFWLTVTLVAVAAAALFLRRELLLVSFDREMAIVLGKRVAWWDAVLYLLIGATISVCVMTAGPLLTFGLLVLPPLTARLLTRRMLAFSLAASALGGLSAFLGFYLAYRFDLPLGPTAVMTGLVLLAITTAASWGRSRS